MSVLDDLGAYLGSKNTQDRAIKRDKLANYSWLVFSDEDYEGYKRSSNIRSAVLALAAIVLSLLCFAIVNGRQEKITLSELTTREKTSKEIELDMALEYKGQNINKDVFLTVLPKKIDLAAANVLFDECEEWIREIFNEGLDFPSAAPNGVEIVWQNSDFSYIGVDEPEERNFIAQLAVGEFSRLAEFNAVLDPNAENYKDSLRAMSEALQDSLSRSENGENLELPSDENGVSVTWGIPRQQAPTAIIALGFFLAAMIILSRRDGEKKQLKKRQELFEYEVPSLSFQLMLYLNAGLTMDAAFTRLLKQNENNYNPLYRALRDIRNKANAGNTSFASELYSYAGNCGSASFLRLATLVFEHSARGSELSEKLERERLLMQEERLGRAQTRLKTAETKLCFPLMMLLVALVLITTVPSFLSM